MLAELAARLASPDEQIQLDALDQAGALLPSTDWELTQAVVDLVCARAVRSDFDGVRAAALDRVVEDLRRTCGERRTCGDKRSLWYDPRGANLVGAAWDFTGLRVERRVVFFDLMQATDAELYFDDSVLDPGSLHFWSADLTGSLLSFRRIRFTDWRILFRHTTFQDCHLDFTGADLSGGSLGFPHARLRSTRLDFGGVKPRSGVNFANATITDDCVIDDAIINRRVDC